jgi:TonB family protein
MADVDSAPQPTQLEAAARGVFLMPGGDGSGTGRAGIGAADQGVGAGGSGTGGNGTGTTGQGGSGQAGDGATGLASRGGGGGTGGGDGAAGLLRSIRHQIEQAKIYPEVARREGIQGTVELRFRIAVDGSIEAVEILRSSGSAILDEASQQTIRRAAPYPLVRGWIRLPLSYRLDR